MKITFTWLQATYRKLTTKKHTEASNGSNTGHSTHKEDSSKEPAINEAIPHTPFRLVGDPENGYIITCGKYAVTEKQPTKKAAINWYDDNIMHVITNMIVIMPSIIKEAEELKTFTEQKMDKEHNAL